MLYEDQVVCLLFLEEEGRNLTLFRCHIVLFTQLSELAQKHPICVNSLPFDFLFHLSTTLSIKKAQDLNTPKKQIIKTYMNMSLNKKRKFMIDSYYLASSMFFNCFFVVHDSVRSCKH